jgi:UDP-N-acetylglucosamine transferase subunit ALG13
VIFVTVGAQMPFDRLVRAVDEWAGARERTDVLAQIGRTEWRPRRIAWKQFMEPKEFRANVERADVIVAHAGMGSIITALELGKPILVMPRRGSLRETRNDHQVATAAQFARQARVAVAGDERELPSKLDEIGKLAASERIPCFAPERLLSAIRAVIDGNCAEQTGAAKGAVMLRLGRSG